MGENVLTVLVRDDAVAVIRYDVPGEAVNTLRPSFAEELEQVLARIADDPKVRAAILTSGKEGSFIVGADIERLRAAKTAAEAEALCRRGHVTAEKIEGSSKPIVAAIHGPALGGGLEVALACQGRVLSSDKETVLGLPEVQLGLLPGMNGLQRLARIAGIATALEYGLTGENLSPSKAKRLGVADDVVPAAILEEAAAKLALSLAESRSRTREQEERAPRFGLGPSSRSPRKSSWLEALTAIAMERNPIGRAVMFRRAREETRGETGGHYPAPERIVDVLEAYGSRGLEASRDVEARAFGELVMSTTAHRLMEIFFATNATAAAVGKMQGRTAINDGVDLYTSRILVPYMNEAAWLLMDGVAIDAIDRALVAWGFPVGPMTLFDEVGFDVAAHEGPILSNVGPSGPSGSRNVGPSGPSGSRNVGPSGPSGSREAFGDRIEAPPAVSKLVDDGRKGRKNERGFYLYGEAAKKAARTGPLGIGSRRGKVPDDSVYSVLGLSVPERGAKGRIAIEEIQMRCALQLVNEALHCFGEGVLRAEGRRRSEAARDGDIGAIFGLGFPPFRGGPFRYVDTLGPAEALKRIESYHGRFGARWKPAPILVEMARGNQRFYDSE